MEVAYLTLKLFLARATNLVASVREKEPKGEPALLTWKSCTYIQLKNKPQGCEDDNTSFNWLQQQAAPLCKLLNTLHLQGGPCHAEGVSISDDFGEKQATLITNQISTVLHARAMEELGLVVVKVKICHRSERANKRLNCDILGTAMLLSKVLLDYANQNL